MGAIDAFVYAHHPHRRIENPGNFGNCMKGRIRLMTAITPACAHAYQVVCLTRHVLTASRLNFRFPKTKKPDVHIFPNGRSTTRERGKDFQRWAIYSDGRTRVVEGETLARWGVRLHAHPWKN